MDTNIPCCSTSAPNEDNNNFGNDCILEEICNTEGITVWGEHQEVLEEQALQQIQSLANELANKQTPEELEDGELPKEANPGEVNKTDRNGSNIVAHKNTRNTGLDINKFLQRQEELKRKQQIVRQSQVSRRSRSVADTVSKRQLKETTVHVANRNIDKQRRVKKQIEPTGKRKHDSDSEYIPSAGELSDVECPADQKTCKRKKKFNDGLEADNSIIVRVRDDGSLICFKNRLELYYKQLELENELKKSALGDDCVSESDEEGAGDDYLLNGGLKVPKSIWRRLYSYQQDGVEWLWGIHQKQMGGLLGDEMGLGKTVQIIAFLAALSNSKIMSKHGRYKGLGATLIVAPVTVIHQWVKHFHEWWPEFRVVVLHQSGSYVGNKTQLIKDVNKENAVLITTYSGVLKYKEYFNELLWHYIILDEGHKIRNHTAQVTVAVKHFTAEHRLILTGSPMQNNLQELWSLFDFISPGILGSQQVFIEHFSNPIMQGGYMNATHIQEATALSVATALKDLITPHMLRRAKADVSKLIALPHKSEQVLFCALTDEQKDLYKGYLMSDHVSNILGRGSKNWNSENHMRANMLVAITTLRKICNHPDLYLGDVEDQFDGKTDEELPIEDKFGYYKRSGKMVVVAALLKIWKRQGHRVLLFTQSRGMITVFQTFLTENGFKYYKMDGSTNIASRQPMIDAFNVDASIDVFLLTTRVGGLGVNLTGANRVIIFDPDWNPAIDTQARERAWRIGQKKQVTIYRLLSAGTIEEKMYQRQVWKQLLSNKVLLDPRTQRVFKTSDLHDLFTLQESISGSKPETANIFRSSNVKLPDKPDAVLNNETKSDKQIRSIDPQPAFDDDKIQAMRNLAQQIAKSMSQPKLTEDEKEKKERKEFIKTLTPLELRMWNRTKDIETEEEQPVVNKIDDTKTNVSFSKALSLTVKSAVIDTKKGSSKIDEKSHKKKKKKHKKEKQRSERVKVDQTGVIEGEEVECLVKREVRKNYTGVSNNNKSQDDYVLQKLFNKSGVSTALQHDVIVQSGYNNNNNSFKIRTEAQNKADLALIAIRKSRVKNWSW